MVTETIGTATTNQQVYTPDSRKPDFFVYSGAMKAVEEGERPTVLATASSTAVDLESDRFTTNALKQMKEGFVGRLIFLNHSYKVPQDVFGVVQEAALVKREGRLDLDLKIGVEMNNPLAVQTYQYIVNGTRLGVSVGVIVTEAEKSDEEDEYGKKIVDINGVIPLEASVVGIPANQTAWTREAVKSLFMRGAIDLDEDDIDARPWLKTVAQIKDVTDDSFEELDVIGKGAVGSHRPAKAPKGRAWQSSSAVKRMRSWAGGPDKDSINWSKYRTGFAWFDASNRESFGSYKLPHHDIVGGSFTVVFRGAVAAAVVLQGGRGGVSIPEGDVGGVKRHVATHYHQFDEKAPWEREKSADWLDIEREVATDLQIDLPDFAEAAWPDDEEENMDKQNEDASAEEKAAADDGPVMEIEDRRQAQNTPPDDAVEDETDKDSEPTDNEDKAQENGSDEEADSESADVDKTDDAADDSENKGDFEDDVTADEAADLLIDKMYTGFRVAVNNLIKIILNSDLSPDEREKEGSEIIESWKEFIEKAWDEVIEHLSSASKSEREDDYNLDAQLHDLIAEQQGLSCEPSDSFKGILAKVDSIQEAATGLVDENARLREENERQRQALDYATQVIEVVMQLPLPTVTTQATKLARNLAERFPALDNRVVERLARYMPASDREKE